MQEIPLQFGYVHQSLGLTDSESVNAWVDDEDYERLAQHKWYASGGVGTVYAVTVVRGSTLLSMHKMILPSSKGIEVDHKDRVGLNNQKENLRRATHSQNRANRGVPSNSTSGLKGVCRLKDRWKAEITVAGKHINLGQYTDKYEAARAYDQAAIKYFGEFALTNHIIMTTVPPEILILRHVNNVQAKAAYTTISSAYQGLQCL
jgi:hypothetical protein